MSTTAESLKDDEALSFKERKERKLKRTAESGHNWNAMFMKVRRCRGEAGCMTPVAE